MYSIYQDYEKIKTRRGKFDLSDLVADLHIQLNNKNLLGDKMDFVYVDEVQDLTMRQIILFRYICKNVDENFVFCGDIAQLGRTISFLYRAQLLDLAVSLLPGLDAKEIAIVVVPIQLGLKFSDELISRRLEEMLSLMIEVLPSCHFSAKRNRLDCLYFLIIHVSKDGSEQRRHVTASFLTEIILALKEVAGGLAGETPRMNSALMEGLTHLPDEFSDLVSTVYNVLPSIYLLLQRKNREIIKAILGLLEVLVAKSHAEALQKHLQSMVEGLLSWQDSTENHFKAKVKLP
ncbi:ARM repeat superfamily protein [Abeliophyllum distichum]|uniref:ARM repeat superfamily protein n=1 Tax=Abeliophyllum distichum TaxID=126358 RepID=A0ABD1Q1T8_9LAMI